MNKKGILLCGHGSKLKKGVEAFNKFANEFQLQIDGYETESAFLEISEPNFDTGVKKLKEKGVSEIIALPLFLFTGIHIEKDIPCMLYQAAKKHDISIKMGKYMGVCKEMVDISENLIREAASKEILETPKDTALVVAGVGSSRIQANADVSALVRLIQERFKFEFSTIGFLSRMTFPQLEAAMKNVSLLPYKNVIVLQYFFFPGIYMKRGEVALQRTMKEYPEKKIVYTNLLASDQGLHDLLKKRMEEVLSGEVDMIANLSKDELENYKPHNHGCGHGHRHEHGHRHGHHHNSKNKGKCKHSKKN